jgi:hypothetical protein
LPQFFLSAVSLQRPLRLFPLCCFPEAVSPHQFPPPSISLSCSPPPHHVPLAFPSAVLVAFLAIFLNCVPPQSGLVLKNVQYSTVNSLVMQVIELISAMSTEHSSK